MFTVVWTEHALDDLADVWVQVDTPTRERIDIAVQWFNAALRLDPFEVGESRSNRRRIGFAGPLVIVFRIDETTSTVRVNHAWRYGR